MTCNKSLSASMKHRITIQQVTQSSDGQGGFSEEWTSFADVWASIEPVKAYEKFQASQLQAPISHKIIIRYLSGLTAKHRILWGLRVMNIKEVINIDENNAFMRITALEQA